MVGAVFGPAWMQLHHSMTRGVSAAVVLTALMVAVPGASAAPVYVNCQDRRGHLHAMQHPRNCDLQGLPPATANLIQLIDASWTHWGAGKTAAKGRIRANHGGEVEGEIVFPAAPHEVGLSRIRRGCHGRLYYTRVRVLEGGGGITLPASCRI
jgi:hypothetical protein